MSGVIPFKWWQRRDLPENPAVDIPVKGPKGDVIGRVIVNSDGTFVGEIKTEGFHKDLSRGMSLGLVEGVSFTPNIKPPKPPWVKGE